MKTGLSGRLQAVYDMVTEKSVVADVGCDHAFLSMALVSTGRSPEAYACDINRGPLKKAAENIAAAGLSGKVHTVLSDGLTGLDAAVDTIVIAGMGGTLIVSILEKSLKKVKAVREIILSPQSDAEKVRNWLLTNGFLLTEEKALTDSGKYYEIIRVVPSDDPEAIKKSWECAIPDEGCRKYAMKYGPYLIRHQDKALMDHLEKRKLSIEEILSGLDPSGVRYRELGEELRCITVIKKEEK